MAGVREGTLFNVSQLSDGLRGASRHGKERRLNLWLEEYRSIRSQCRATANRVIGRHMAHRHLLAEANAKLDPTLEELPGAADGNIRVDIPKQFPGDAASDERIHILRLEVGEMHLRIEQFKAQQCSANLEQAVVAPLELRGPRRQLAAVAYPEQALKTAANDRVDKHRDADVVVPLKQGTNHLVAGW